MVLYVPGTEETDPKKQNMSLQQIGGATTTAIANIATNTASISEITSAWSTWTPTFSMTTVGGTPITASVSAGGARYKQIGKTIHFSLDAVISNIGVGNGGQFTFTLPVAMQSANALMFGVGKEAITLGKQVALQGLSTTLCGIMFYDNTSLISGGNGTRPICGGTYEAA